MIRNRKNLIAVVALCAVSLLLGGVAWLAESSGWPPILEGPGAVVYRLVYMSMTPVHYLSRLIEFSSDPHWGGWQLPAVAVMTPFFWGGLFAGTYYLSKAIRQRISSRRRLAASFDLGRRRFLATSSSGAAFVAAGGLGVYSSSIVPQQLQVARYELPIRDLPAALDGLRVVQLSDTHYGPFITLPYLRRAVAEANALQPDLIVLTGDYVHRSPKAIAPGIQALAGLKARLGIAGVLGNHDHWEGAQACCEEFVQLGIPLVDNNRIFLTPDGIQRDATDGALCVAGLGDYWEAPQDFAAALDKVPEDMPRILLAHNPDSAEGEANGRRVDLMLSGHTHGGQIAFPVIGTPIIPSKFGQKYRGGLVQGPWCPVLVSRGVGMTVLPLRFGVPPEISLLTLRAAGFRHSQEK